MTDEQPNNPRYWYRDLNEQELQKVYERMYSEGNPTALNAYISDDGVLSYSIAWGIGSVRYREVKLFDVIGRN